MNKHMIFLILLLTVFELSANEARPRVYLQIPESQADNTQLKAVSTTIYDTAYLILSQMSEYELLASSRGAVEDIASYSRDNNIDNFISGSCSMDEEGSIEISLFAYGREKNEILEEKKERTDSVLDVFEIVDNMVIDLLAEFSGRHIAFGSLELEPRGNRGRYSYTLDGISYSDEQETIDRILIGDHKLIIQQDRMNGSHTLIDETISIAEGETLSYSFSVPDILLDEESQLTEQQDVIEKYRDKKRKEDKVDAAYAQMLLILENTDYSETITLRKTEIGKQQAAWEEFKITRAGDQPWEKRQGRHLFSLGTDMYAGIVFSNAAYEEFDSDDMTRDLLVLDFYPALSISYQYFLTNHQALNLIYCTNFNETSGFADYLSLGTTDGEPENFDPELQLQLALGMGYEYYFKRFFMSGSFIYRGYSLDYYGNEFPSEWDNPEYLNQYSLTLGLGWLFNQDGRFNYKLYFLTSPVQYSYANEDNSELRTFTDLTIGFSMGYNFRGNK